MTAVAILGHSEGMFIATDGAAYYPSTRLISAIVTKIILCPEWDCVITGRGAGGAAEVFRLIAQEDRVADFDDLVGEAETLARETHRTLEPKMGPDDTFSVILAGYSRSRDAFEIWVVASNPGSIWAMPSNSVEINPAFAVMQGANALFAPQANAEAAARVGLVLPHELDGPIYDPGLYVQQMVVAGRFCPENGTDAGVAPCFVGGFVQYTRIVKQPGPVIVMESRITHRWPDAIGETMDPERGELPAWLGEKPCEHVRA